MTSGSRSLGIERLRLGFAHGAAASRAPASVLPARQWPGDFVNLLLMPMEHVLVLGSFVRFCGFLAARRGVSSLGERVLALSGATVSGISPLARSKVIWGLQAGRGGWTLRRRIKLHGHHVQWINCRPTIIKGDAAKMIAYGLLICFIVDELFV